MHGAHAAAEVAKICGCCCVPGMAPAGDMLNGMRGTPAATQSATFVDPPTCVFPPLVAKVHGQRAVGSTTSTCGYADAKTGA